MLTLLLFTMLTVLTFVWLTRNLEKARWKKEAQCARLRENYADAVTRAGEIMEERNHLFIAFDETVALYDITKEITKSLDEEKVFAAFRDKLGQYIRFRECKYFKDRLEPGYERSLSFKLGDRTTGFLAANGIEDRDAEKFHIMGEQFILGIKRAILYRQVQELATYDSLTHVYTRRYWFERSHQEVERSQRFNLNACCLMIDVDHFKDINDRYGHLVGDAILVEVSKMIRENIRQIDLYGRYGGEEFSILLTETDTDNAVYAAERIRKAIEQRNIRAYDEELHVTVSIGVSSFSDGMTLEKLIEDADTSLYKAKQSGRNRVCTHGESS